MKKILLVFSLVIICGSLIFTVSAASGNATIVQGGATYELIEKTGTDVYAYVKASYMSTAPINVHAIMQKKFLAWWTNQANAIIPVSRTGLTHYAQFAANAPGTVKGIFKNLTNGSTLTGRFEVK